MTYDLPKVSAFTPFARRFTDERARDLRDTIALYRDVRAEFEASVWANPNTVETLNVRLLDAIASDLTSFPDVLGPAAQSCLTDILRLETALFTFPVDIDFDTPLSLQELVDLRHFLRAQQHFLANQDRVIETLTNILFSIFTSVLAKLPRLPSADEAFCVPLYSFFPDIGETVDKVIGTITRQEALDVGIFAELGRRLTTNVYTESGVPLDQESKRPLVTANQSKLPPEELLRTYLRDTPFLEFFLTPVPFEVPLSVRFEHHWMVAGSGHGKTQAIQYLIARDLERVSQGEASVIVIDSQGDLIRNISGLAAFAPGGPLADRLCLIDPTDIEFPCALNLFSLGTERLAAYSQLDREKLQNAAVELYEFILGALLGAEMTSKQSTLFRYVLRLMLQIEGATIHTFREIMADGIANYRASVTRLPRTAQTFFETEFDSREFMQTRSQVTRRIWAILENQTFERMFSHPKNKLDLFSEMNEGKVILVNTAKDLLKQQGTEIFGRFFIAMIAQAAQERATLPHGRRTPVLCYVDECQDYLDQNVALILEQARKFNVGMILAHQYIGQLAPKLQESFAANTSIKFAGGVSDRDARAMSHMLRCEPGFIESQPKGSFAAFIRNLTPSAITMKVPFGYLEALERMTEDEQKWMRDQMRARYAVPWRDVEPAESTVPLAKPSIDPDAIDSKASSDW